jgi:hypothetical protein
LDEAVLYCLPGSGATIYFTREAVVIDLKERVEVAGEVRALRHSSPERLEGEQDSACPPLRGCAVEIRFEGANPSPPIEARGELVTRYNYILGNDPSEWQTNVPAFSEIIYHDVWPGIDLIYREERGAVIYEIVATPGADPEQARFHYEGAERVSPSGEGIYRIETQVGSFLDTRPFGGVGVGTFMWVAQSTNPEEEPASVDNPSALLWGTYLGGGSNDSGYGIAFDASGNPVIVGYTGSSNFPTPGGYDQSFNGDYDVFVAKLSASGDALLWGTYLGGGEIDYGFEIAFDASGNPVIVGYTYSSDFPTPGGYDQSFNGDYDVFVAKLSASGDALLWGTYLGGSDGDFGNGIALDASGNPVVRGGTGSSDFPTPGGYDQSFNGDYDVFVAKLSASGDALLWGTYLGGGSRESGLGFALDASGNPVVTGYTYSSDFPTPGGYDQSFNGGFYDVFVAKLSASGDALLWGTYLGGGENDLGYGIALDASGNPVVTGRTRSSDFPTPGGYDQSYNGNGDVFVAKLSNSGDALLWGTYLGGSSYDSGIRIALDASGNPVVTGETDSPDFPTLGGYDQSYNGNGDVFVAKLSSSGDALLRSTYLGGGGHEESGRIALDASGNPVVTGETWSSDFPTPGGYDQSFNGGLYDVFVAKLDGGDGAADISVAGPYFASVSKDWTQYDPDTECPRTDREYISVIISNSGGVGLSNVSVRFEITGQSPQDRLISHLGVGSSEQVEVAWAIDHEELNRQLTVTVDPLDEIDESDEENNTVQETVSLWYAEKGNGTYHLCEDAYSFENWTFSEQTFHETFISFITSSPLWNFEESVMLWGLYPLWALATEWGGHCYGMASTACLYFESPYLKPRSMDVFGMPKESDVVAKIDEYHHLQFWHCLEGLFSPSVSRQVLEECRDQLVGELEDTGLPMMALVSGLGGGHAMQAYKVLDRGNRVIVNIYDNNDALGLASVSRVMVLDLDEGTLATSWERPYYDEFLDDPDWYPLGFPYWTKQNWDMLMFKHPRRTLDDGAVDLLHYLYSLLVGSLAAENNILLSLGSPVKGLITDDLGRRIGFVGDEFINEIPGAELSEGLEVEVYWLPGGKDYQVQVSAIAQGSMTLNAIIPEGGTAASCRCLQWRDIALQENTHCSLAISDTADVPSLLIDYDNDGVVDSTVEAGYDSTVVVPSADRVPPELTVAVLQNPYLTQYLDIYLIGSEALDPATVHLEVDGRSVVCRLVDSEESVWMGDFKLESSADVISIEGRASDKAGNDATITAQFSSALISASDGGSITSPDGLVALSFKPNTLRQSAYVLIIPYPDEKQVLTGASATSMDWRSAAVLTDSHNTCAYCFSPAGLSLENSAYIEFYYDELQGEAPDDNVQIMQEGVGLLDSYIDIKNRKVSACISQLGTFRLVSGHPGESIVTDFAYLFVGRPSPSPFSETTTLYFDIRAPQRVSANIYDTAGRHIACVHDDILYPGSHEVTWNGSTRSGQRCSAGIYFCRVEAGGTTQTRKMILAR